MIYLFDDQDGQSQKMDCYNWAHAEWRAWILGWTVVGIFIAEVE